MTFLLSISDDFVKHQSFLDPGTKECFFAAVLLLLMRFTVSCPLSSKEFFIFFYFLSMKHKFFLFLFNEKLV